MGRLYSFYEQRVFPRFLDVAMKQMEKLRPRTLAGAHGEVLEIGFGTGLNLDHYPEAVERLCALDPMAGIPASVQARIDARIQAAPFPVERFPLRADGRLPFEAAHFDSVTVTFTLCTIPDVALALGEMHRVLKPAGQLHFAEHGRSDVPAVARWQDRLNPVQNVIGCGCNLNRKIDALIEQAGFRLEELDFFCLDKAPRVVGTIYQGVASPA